MDIDLRDSPFAHWLLIFLDDERVDECVAASEEGGWVDLLWRDRAGQPVYDVGGRTRLVQRYVGQVTIAAHPAMPEALWRGYRALRARALAQAQDQEG